MADTLLVVDLELTMASIAATFEGHPHRGLQQLRQWKDSGPHQFSQQAAEFLSSATDSRFARLLFHLLQEEHPSLDAFLFSPLALTGSAAANLAALACRIEPRVQTIWTTTLLHQLEQLSESEVLDEVLRRMEVLANCADRLRFAPLLQKLSIHAEPKIRSKAALLSPLVHSLGEELPALRDENARVRANALESMWGRSDSRAIEIFKASQGRVSHREAINAVLGLHFAGELSARNRLIELAESDNSRNASAAIWAMGMTKDPRLLSYLQSRLKLRADPLQLRLLRAARRIKAFQDEAESLPPLSIRPIRLEWLGLGRIQLSLLLLNSLGQPCDPSKILPVHFMLRDGDRHLDQFQVQVGGSPAQTELLFLLPAGVSGSFASLHAASRAKRKDDLWSAQHYPTAATRRIRLAPRFEFTNGIESLEQEAAKITPVAGDSFEASVERAISNFPLSENSKRLLLVTDPNCPDSLEPAADWLEKCKRFRIMPYVLATRTLNLAATNSWRRFCTRLNGTFVEHSPAAALEDELANACLALQSSVHITCHLGRVHEDVLQGSSVWIEMISELGAARLELNPEAISSLRG
jgi:hypothetical protein